MVNQFVDNTMRMPGESIYVDIASNGAERIHIKHSFNSITLIAVTYEWGSQQDRVDLMVGIEQLW